MNEVYSRELQGKLDLMNEEESIPIYSYIHSELVEVCAEKLNCEKSYKFSIFIDSLNYFETIKEGVDYYKDILIDFEEFFNKNVDVVEKDIYDEHKNKGLKYRSYDVEIIELEEYSLINTEAPYFFSLYDLYLWLKGVVEQLYRVVGIS